MKKILTFLLCLGFAFVFAACGKDSGTSDTSSSSATAEQNSESGSDVGGNDAETAFFNVTAEYDYDSHVENRLSILYGGCELFFDIPEEHGEVIAGDSFLITYTGELTIYETQPSSVSISGEIVSVTAQKAKTVALICQVGWVPMEVGEVDTIDFYLYNDGEVGEQVKIETSPKYYLTNDNGEIGCEELTTAADGMVFYGTYSPVNGYDETDGYTLSGLYSWNPREE